MKFSSVKAKTNALLAEASFLLGIKSQAEYERALSFMDELIDDYDNSHPLIDLLSTSIERWKYSSPEFTEFNTQVAGMDDVVAARWIPPME